MRQQGTLLLLLCVCICGCAVCICMDCMCVVCTCVSVGACVCVSACVWCVGVCVSVAGVCVHAFVHVLSPYCSPLLLLSLPLSLQLSHHPPTLPSPILPLSPPPTLPLSPPTTVPPTISSSQTHTCTYTHLIAGSLVRTVNALSWLLPRGCLS